MKSFFAKSLPAAPSMLLVCILLPLLAHGQQENRGKPNQGGMNPVIPARAPSIRERQFILLEMEREAGKPRTPEDEQLALAQIAEDFEKIQVINNKMMGATMRAVTPDYGRIADVTAEIKSRANRLRQNMQLARVPEKEGEKAAAYKKAENAEGIKSSLLSLDNSIMSFIKNPIFKSPRVVDLDEAIKARHDVDIIIQLSDRIKKDSERLGKAGNKPD